MQSFADTLNNSTTIDETAGSIQNIDQQFIQDQLVQYQQEIEEYFNAHLPSDATVEELLGSKTIQASDISVLPSGLPYESLSITNRFSDIPSKLRHKYRITFKDQYGWDIFSRTLDLPAIAGSTLALSFSPATAADEETLQRFIPDVTDISQLPTSLPGYLIKLEADLVIDNIEQATGVVVQMGEEITMTQALYSPQFGMEKPIRP